MIYLCVCVSSVSFWPSVLKITITIIIIIAGVIIEMLFGEKCELWWISSVAGEVDFWTSIISWFSPATHKPSTLKSIHQWLKSVKLSLTSTRVPTFRRRRRRRPSQTLNAYFLGGTYDNNSIVERGSNGGGGGKHSLQTVAGTERQRERKNQRWGIVPTHKSRWNQKQPEMHHRLLDEDTEFVSVPWQAEKKEFEDVGSSWQLREPMRSSVSADHATNGHCGRHDTAAARGPPPPPPLPLLPPRHHRRSCEARKNKKIPTRNRFRFSSSSSSRFLFRYFSISPFLHFSISPFLSFFLSSFLVLPPSISRLICIQEFRVIGFECNDICPTIGCLNAFSCVANNWTPIWIIESVWGKLISFGSQRERKNYPIFSLLEQLNCITHLSIPTNHQQFQLIDKITASQHFNDHQSLSFVKNKSFLCYHHDYHFYLDYIFLCVSVCVSFHFSILYICIYIFLYNIIIITRLRFCSRFQRGETTGG